MSDFSNRPASACRPAPTSPASAAAQRAGLVAEGVYDTRRARLKLLIEERAGGSQRAFAKQLGYTRSNIHHFLSTAYNHGRSVGERAARKLEHKAGLPYGWMDQAIEVATPVPGNDIDLSEQAKHEAGAAPDSLSQLANRWAMELPLIEKYQVRDEIKRYIDEEIFRASAAATPEARLARGFQMLAQADVSMPPTAIDYDAYFEGCRARGVLPCSRASFDADQGRASGQASQAGRDGAGQTAPGSAEARMAAGFQVLAEVGTDDVLVTSRSALMTLARQLMAEEIDDCEEEFMAGRAHGIGSLHSEILMLANQAKVPLAGELARESLSAVSWLYRRLPRGFGRQAHIEVVIERLARETGTNVSDLVERGPVEQTEKRNEGMEGGNAN